MDNRIEDNCDISNDKELFSPETGICCYCKEECNSLSQACGKCMRYYSSNFINPPIIDEYDDIYTINEDAEDGNNNDKKELPTENKNIQQKKP